MDYQEAINYIYSFINYDKKPSADLAKYNNNLERMQIMLDVLGYKLAAIHFTLCLVERLHFRFAQLNYSQGVKGNNTQHGGRERAKHEIFKLPGYERAKNYE